MRTKLYDSIYLYLYADQDVNSLHYVCKRKKNISEIEDFKIDFIYLEIDNLLSIAFSPLKFDSFLFFIVLLFLLVSDIFIM